MPFQMYVAGIVDVGLIFNLALKLQISNDSRIIEKYHQTLELFKHFQFSWLGSLIL